MSTGEADALPDGVLVIVPTYNERESLPVLLSSIHDLYPSVHVLVVDDGSPDGTGRIADESAEADQRIHVLHRKNKAGLGAAYLAGFSWGLSRGYTILIEMDADGSHQPEYLSALVAGLARADLCLGSRWVDGGGTVNWSRGRKFLSRSGNWYAHQLLKIPVHDATGGYRAYTREALAKLELETVNSQGYCFQVDLVRRAIDRGLRVLEVPIIFIEREHGTSKMNKAIVAEALWNVTRWGISRRLHTFRSRGNSSKPPQEGNTDR